MSLLYQFMDKKHSEGSSYKVYMMASANKFLRICYAFITVKVNTLAQIQLVLNTSLVNRLCIFELFGGLASCGIFLLFEISTLLLFSKPISKPAILRYQRKHLALPIQKQQRWHITPALLVLFNTVTETMRLTAVPPPTSCSPSAGVGRFFPENPRLHAPRSPRPSAPLSSLQASS